MSLIWSLITSESGLGSAEPGFPLSRGKACVGHGGRKRARPTAAAYPSPRSRRLLQACPGHRSAPQLLSIANQKGAATASIVSPRIVGGSLGVLLKVYLTELPRGTFTSTYRPLPYTEGIHPTSTDSASLSTLGSRSSHRRARASTTASPSASPSAPARYTLHPTPYTLHPTPYTLHPKFIYCRSILNLESPTSSGGMDVAAGRQPA